MSFLLDTNIVSGLRRQTRSHAGLQAWFSDQAPDALYLSVITLGQGSDAAPSRSRRPHSNEARFTAASPFGHERVTLAARRSVPDIETSRG